MGIIITTDHESDGIYLDADDRRHFIANSEADKENFDAEYWIDFWGWYAAGGIGHVVAYLRTLDLSAWNAKVVHNQDRKDGLWRVAGRSQAVYALRKLNDRMVVETLRDPPFVSD